MPTVRRRGDRAAGVVPPLVLVVGGLLVALVAGALLLATLLGGGRPPTTSSPTPPVTTAAPTSATTEDRTSSSTSSDDPAGQAAAAPADGPAPTAGLQGWSASARADATDSGTRPPASGSSPSAGSSTGTGAGAEAAVPAGAPAWIRISSAAVDGAIVPQGLAADGTINPGRNEVIWFTGSNRVSPGQVGTSVVAGHVTWEGAPDAFAQLPSVGAGDTVEVGYSDGSSRSFTVTSTAAVDKDALARSLTVWGPHPDRPRLAIITCDPVLGYQADGHTEANFVVIAEG